MLPSSFHCFTPFFSFFSSFSVPSLHRLLLFLFSSHHCLHLLIPYLLCLRPHHSVTKSLLVFQSSSPCYIHPSLPSRPSPSVCSYLQFPSSWEITAIKVPRFTCSPAARRGTINLTVRKLWHVFFAPTPPLPFYLCGVNLLYCLFIYMEAIRAHT